MNLASFLSLERTLCSVPCSSKKRALELVASHVASDFDNISSEDIFTHLFDRERLGSTAIGFGIAIPHCRIEGIDQVIGVLATLESPIDFDANDGEPIDILVALLAPMDANDDHLRALAALAEKLQNKSFIGQLRSAKSTPDLYHLAIN